MVEFKGECNKPGLYCVYLNNREGKPVYTEEHTSLAYIFAKSGRDAFLEVLDNLEEHGYEPETELSPLHSGVERITCHIPGRFKKSLVELIEPKIH